MKLLHTLLLALSILGTLALSAPTDAKDIAASGEVARNNDNNFHELKLDPHGIIHVAGDGIARSYDAEGNVIDHHVLSNEQLLGHVTQLFDYHSPEGERLLQELAHVDGHNVPEHERMNPPDHFKPARFRKGHEDHSQNEAQEVKDELLGKRKNEPRCLGMICFDTHSCRVTGCYACIQTEKEERETKCIIRPYWYDIPAPLVQGGIYCGKKGKRSWLCA